MAEFIIGEHDFLLDGRPHRVLAGALHYFRVHPDLWADRIEKARLMGLNTIETYTPWNLHEPVEGAYDFTGMLDLERFLRLVADAGMHAIVRPGPYICAEWDNGGLPAWLYRDPEVGVRRSEPRYLGAVSAYLRRVYDVVTPLQIDRGGPVVLVQIENEYGAYGSDKFYLRHLVDLTRECGITVPLTTVDQPTDEMLSQGSLDCLHRTGSFGSRATERLATLRRHQPTGPLMCSEFWNGWFDHWGDRHHTTSAEDSAAELDALLAAGASVNIYMFHGGTNFGLTSGANDKGVYQPTITSYDYDAPLDEAGNPTAKYHAFREVIARYAPVPGEAPPPAKPAPEFSVELDAGAYALKAPESWGTWERHEALPELDELESMPRMALYRTTVDSDVPATLVLGEVRDRVSVFLDGQPVGTLLRQNHERALGLDKASGELVLLVEDMGRVNYGPRLGEAKGVIGGATLNGKPLTGWDVLPIELGAPPDAAPTPDGGAGPVLRRARFDLDGPADLFLDTLDWGKGIAWVNGFCLGRYWSLGPQRTLYVPAPVLRAGANELAVLETATAATTVAHFRSGPELGHTEA
ncbi:beta-galactosidase [Actinosynnema pretiosum subsp. pretiosum]|uniref:Beta-galactosidase n=1 Tax=Actinosynnema pretiosum subsp. pretiosum TaxID=103721 RepID=A0AA45L9L0_9PSEU|nr:Beta-galactosidase [Actinosynnema pretiosum subsp. pretiosum]QUF05846.1 beta-galactosidase [Actinosynnema pretiosum subsp. pretiosum]